MMPYASRTGTRKNLDALRRRRWGLLVSATGCVRTEGWPEAGLPYGLDNGAWTAFQAGTRFDVKAFERAVELVGDSAEFIIVPDIVAGGLDSLEFSLEWIPKLEGIGRRRLLAVQDGMRPEDIGGLLGDSVGIFVGGSTEWKWAHLPIWGRLARKTECYLHVGRVNTTRRFLECIRVGVDSVDGTSVTRFSKNINKLDSASKQEALFPDALEDHLAGI